MSKYIKCPVCNEEIVNKENIYTHIESEHAAILPQGWSGARFYFQQIHGRTTANCVICGDETGWNDKTNKPYRFCKKPKCKKIYVETFKKRMKQKYGKEHLLDDPQIQQKMLHGRSISGEYVFKDGGKVPYVGSYEGDFLQFLDVFLGFHSRDVMECPHYFEYYYEGEKKLYIPDFFIPSINTIVEIKDGGENPNTHYKIQEIDKVKEKAKDDVMIKQKEFNYIKITDKNYKPFLDFLVNLKDNYDYTTMKFKRPLTFIGEHTNLLLEGLKDSKNSLKEEFELLDEQSKSTKDGTLSSEEIKEIKERFGEISCWIVKDKNGKYYARTHRVRSKSYDSIQDIPKEVIRSIAHK